MALERNATGLSQARTGGVGGALTYLLIRRNRSRPDELAYYVAFAPREQASIHILARVAGQRWKIEQGFQIAKGECGLDDYEVRRWGSWHRHITLALLAHALLVAMRQAISQEKTP